MDDVGNEADAARHSFSNKTPVSFIFFGIIDHHWWSMIAKKMKLTGTLFDELCLAASAYIENVFLFVTSRRWQTKKESHNGPLKLQIKVWWVSFFLESSIIIDDRWLQKE